MKILVVNAGSSSLKYQLFDIDTGKDNYEKREVQLDYKIWYKLVD